MDTLLLILEIWIKSSIVVTVLFSMVMMHGKRIAGVHEEEDW